MEEIELLNNEIEDFMRKVPSAIVRYGTGLMFVVVLALIFASAIFKYPNTLKVPVTIYTKNSSWHIVKRTDLNIISTDDTLAYREIMKLKSWLLTDSGNSIPLTKKNSLVPAESTIDFRNIERWEKKHVETVLINQANDKGVLTSEKKIGPPFGNDRLWGVLRLTPTQVAKVKTGQRVIIKLEKYVDKGPGTLEGKVGVVSSLKMDVSGNNHYYEATVLIPEHMPASFNQDLSADSLLAGDAEVITSYESLLERILKPVYAIRQGVATK